MIALRHLSLNLYQESQWNNTIAAWAHHESQVHSRGRQNRNIQWRDASCRHFNKIWSGVSSSDGNELFLVHDLTRYKWLLRLLKGCSSLETTSKTEQHNQTCQRFKYAITVQYQTGTGQVGSNRAITAAYRHSARFVQIKAWYWCVAIMLDSLTNWLVGRLK